MRIFKGLLIAALIILISMSLLALIAVHWILSQKTFAFTPKGIENYLTALGGYKTLFTATVATMTAYFGFYRLKSATDANVQKLKQDRFTEWKYVLDVGFIEIEKSDRFMKREFIKRRRNLFEQLYSLNFKIENKTQLNQVFGIIFREVAIFFEQQNNKHIEMGGVHPDSKHSYSFESFRFIFLGCVDTYYETIVDDLREMYLSCLPADRHIDFELYKMSLKVPHSS